YHPSFPTRRSSDLVIFLRERSDLRRLRVIKNADAAETRKTVVILKDDHEHVIEPRDAVLVILVILGPRSRHAYCERQTDCQSEQISFHRSTLSCRACPVFIRLLNDGEISEV